MVEKVEKYSVELSLTNGLIMKEIKEAIFRIEKEMKIREVDYEEVVNDIMEYL